MDLDEALNMRPLSQRGRAPEVAKKRQLEQIRRYRQAERMANRALANVHRDEFDAFFRQAAEQVAAERGPLPGDEA